MGNGMKIGQIFENNIGVYLQQLIALYRNVFSESSWEEGLKCCNEGCQFNCSYTKSPSNNRCPNCESELTDYYTEGEVEGFIMALFERKYYQALIGLNDTGKVVAFTWGWVSSLVSLNDEKMGLCEEKLSELQKKLSDAGFDVEDNFYYLSEMGVSPDSQGNGYGKELVGVIEGIVREGVENIILRTSEDSGMYSIAMQKGYRIVYEYRDTAKRVLFAKKNNRGS